MLDAAELADMRETLELSLPDSCVLVTITNAPNGQGGYTETTADSTAIACRIGPVPFQGREGEQQGRVEATAAWVVTLPAETTVTEGDRITSGGVTYEVTEVLAPRSYEVSRRVIVTKAT